jgi:hypothetical protein
MLYKLTVKSNLYSNGVRLEKGMSVEVAFHQKANLSSLLSDGKGQQLVINAFKAKYGVDVKKAGAFTSRYLNLEKID